MGGRGEGLWVRVCECAFVCKYIFIHKASGELRQKKRKNAIESHLIETLVATSFSIEAAGDSVQGRVSDGACQIGHFFFCARVVLKARPIEKNTLRKLSDQSNRQRGAFLFSASRAVEAMK